MTNPASLVEQGKLRFLITDAVRLQDLQATDTSAILRHATMLMMRN